MKMVPDGYRVRETDDRVAVMGTRMTKWGAEKLKRDYPPITPSYHLRIERRGFLKWDVVAYQNVLEEDLPTAVRMEREGTGPPILKQQQPDREE